MGTFMIFDGYETSMLKPFPCIEAKTRKEAIMKLIQEREYNIRDVDRDGGRLSKFSATPVIPSTMFDNLWCRTGKIIWFRPIIGETA